MPDTRTGSAQRTVVVTGGAGYIGSFVADELVAQGYRTVVLDSLYAGHRAAVPADREFHEIDIRDADALKKVLQDHCREADAVIHFAALTQVGESVREPARYWETNLIGTKNLLDAMAAAGIHKLVFSSTAATYGNPVAIMNEQHPQQPINPYGHTKLAMEFLIRDYVECPTSELRAIALRYFNACGAAEDGSRGEDHSPETHLLPLVVAAGLGIRNPARNFHGKVTVFGSDYETRDGTCERDYINVLDLSQAHLAALRDLDTRPAHYMNSYNVGTGSGHTVKEVIDIVREVIRSELNAAEVDLPVEIGPRRAGDPAKLVAEAVRLRNELGWSPRYSLEQSARSVIRWMRSHPNGYKS